MTGRDELKIFSVARMDWDGRRAAVAAGIRPPDLPGACGDDEVNAASPAAAPSHEKLREFVRCAAALLESKGYFAKDELEGGVRWSHESVYVFVIDVTGDQVLTGNRIRVNGHAIHEWGAGGVLPNQFGGRDIAAVGHDFGEFFLHYWGSDPTTWPARPNVAFLKRVVAHGVPLLEGTGYDLRSMPDRPRAVLTTA